MSSEFEFTSNYLLLLSLSNQKDTLISDDFSKSLRTLSPFTLPKLPPLPVSKKSTSSTHGSFIINTHFNSIKAPKFKISLELSSTLSIYDIKKLLLLELNLNNAELKLLIRGKVVQDGELLSDLSTGDDLKFIVIVGAPIDPALDAAPPNAHQEQEQEQVKDLPWSEILEVLKSSGFDESDLKRLQNGWKLSK